MSGYEFGNKTRPIYAIRPGASGDISLKGKATSNDFVAWSLPSAGSYNSSPLIYGDHFYVLYSQGFFACFNARTGEEVYGRQRLGATFTASPWAYDGKAFCLAEDGTTIAIQAGDLFKTLSKSALGEASLATPAIVGTSVLIRTQSKLYRIGK